MDITHFYMVTNYISVRPLNRIRQVDSIINLTIYRNQLKPIKIEPINSFLLLAFYTFSNSKLF